MKKLIRTLAVLMALNTGVSGINQTLCYGKDFSNADLMLSNEKSVEQTLNKQVAQYISNTIVVQDCTLVSLEEICKIANATFVWDKKDNKTITIQKDYEKLILKVGSNMVETSIGTRYLQVAPQIRNNKVMVPLRTMATYLGCDINVDAKSKKVSVVSKEELLVPQLANTTQKVISNWANVSSVQQFLYKDEGLAYGFTYDDQLIIYTPNKKLSIAMKYPILGDIIADNEGNFYIVWGKEGESSSEDTIFISKYSVEGDHLGTTGFNGKSRMGTTGNTKMPFEAGNCVSAIGNGCLMVNYARKMYSGHQSNNVIGIHLSDMSPVAFKSEWDIPYTSHSFNQSVIWSENTDQFIYADHGDAYDRGFVVTSDLGEELLFHFYLQANANYDMFVVNKTFAQLGNLAETSKGVALVGASAKSIGEEAKSEKQNLFIQLFNPSEKNMASKYIKGEERQGKTSMDINDNRNTSLTSVTDYGVNWLTQYTDTDVIAPQVVTVDDCLVILWTTSKDSFYMVLSASGDIIKSQTSLKGVPLNSYERPVVYNGTIYWSAVKDGKLKVYSLKTN